MNVAVSYNLQTMHPLSSALTKDELEALFTPHDLKRLDSYARNLLDYHVCMDMLPSIAKTWFLNRVPVTISVLQSAILLGMGLQHKTIDDLEVCFANGNSKNNTI